MEWSHIIVLLLRPILKKTDLRTEVSAVVEADKLTIKQQWRCIRLGRFTKKR